jgi:hypothetical protein
MDQNRTIIPIQTTQAPDLKPLGIDPHVKLAEMFLAEAKPRHESRKQKNLTEVEIQQTDITRRTRVALVVAPEWTTVSPPYGMARMSALSKHMGFATRCWDINAMCKPKGPTEYWSAYTDWKWQDPHYSEVLHPLIEPLLLKYIDEICEWEPTVIGFSVWYTNDLCTKWVIQQFRNRIPGVKIVIGGANATQLKIGDADIADHVVVGEGELWWVRILENIETPTEELPHICHQDKGQRIDLDSMPPADYSDFDISLYYSLGITCEFSRGCVANCVYCNETIFWKYRSRLANTVLDEIELAYRTKNIRSVYFIDSLLNGNLRELRGFAHGLMERKIRVSWTGYSRIDGKMDREFWHDLKIAGATGFAFGVESGSQKVLDLMKKNCRVEWIEQNFNDMAEIDMHNNFATWFTGFPGEELTDVAQTMTLMWRLRNSGMGGQSCGTCGLGHGTPLDLEREKFGVSAKDWSWGWCTPDFTNTVFHRFIRFKTVNILLEHFRQHNTTHQYGPHNQYPELKNHYSLAYDPANWQDPIPWEKDFDYHVFKIESGNPVEASLINEIWPLLRVLWLAMGAYQIHIKFDPDQDLNDFGYLRYPRGGEHRLWAQYDFEINHNGEWTINVDMQLQADPDYDNHDMNFHTKLTQQGIWQRPLDSVL